MLIFKKIFLHSHFAEEERLIFERLDLPAGGAHPVLILMMNPPAHSNPITSKSRRIRIYYKMN